MSAANEADITAPRHPASYARRPRMRLAVFAGAVLAALIAGWLIGVFGPRPAPLTRAPARPVEAASSQPVAEALPAPIPAAPQPLAVAPAPSELGAVDDRIAALERQQARTAEAAAAALAAATLMEASRGSTAFGDELVALRALAPALPELQGLEPLARVGAPSRASLAASFPEYAARAAVASRAPGEDASLLARVGHSLSRVVTLRRVGEVAGTGPDAIIARAERQVEDGDVERAVRTLYGLPAAGREAMGPWLARAERRAEIDRRVASLRAQALTALSQAAAGNAHP